MAKKTLRPGSPGPTARIPRDRRSGATLALGTCSFTMVIGATIDDQLPVDHFRASPSSDKRFQDAAQMRAPGVTGAAAAATRQPSWVSGMRQRGSQSLLASLCLKMTISQPRLSPDKHRKQSSYGGRGPATLHRHRRAVMRCRTRPSAAASFIHTQGSVCAPGCGRARRARGHLG